MAAGERTIKIKFDGTAAGLARATASAKAQLKALEKQVDKNKKTLEGMANGAGKAAASFAMMAARGALFLSSISTGASVVMAITSALAAMAGILPVAVAGVASLGAVMLTAKLGADGAKRAFAQLTPTLNSLKAAVSKSFESALMPGVNNLKTVIPQLKTGFQSIATAMGGAFTQATLVLKTSAATEQLKTILDNTSKVVKNLGAALGPVLAAFLRIAAVGSGALVGLTSGIGAAADRFNAFVQRAADSGQLQAWIDGAIAAFKSLFSVIGDIGHIIASVFSALDDAGVGLGGTIAVVVGQIREFVDSAQGQEVLRSLATTIKEVGDAVGKILGEALRAVGPAIPPLLDAFRQLVATVTPTFVTVVRGFGVALQAVAGFLQQNMSWLGPVALALGTILVVIKAVVIAFDLWKAAVLAYTAVQWLLNAAMDANPIGLVILAVAALIAIILIVIENLDFFRGIWDAVWKWCSDRITEVVDFIIALWNAYVIIFTDVVNTIREVWDAVWKWVSDRVSDVTGWIGDRWDDAGAFIKSVFKGIGDFIGGIWDGVVSGVKGAINAVIRIINGAISGVNAITGAVGIPAIPSIGYLAKGGTAQRGKSYIVGERGPELFTPGRTGRVTNANTTAEAMGGGGAQTIDLTLDLGEGIRQVVSIQIDKSNRATVRAVKAGAGKR